MLRNGTYDHIPGAYLPVHLEPLPETESQVEPEILFPIPEDDQIQDFLSDHKKYSELYANDMDIVDKRFIYKYKDMNRWNTDLFRLSYSQVHTLHQRQYEKYQNLCKENKPENEELKEVINRSINLIIQEKQLILAEYNQK